MKYFEEENNEKSRHLIDTLDYGRLAEIQKKKLQELSEDDLRFMGLHKIEDEEIKNLYFFADFDNIKIYLNRIDEGFELRGYMLKKEKDILTTKELLDETLIKWKLRM